MPDVLGGLLRTMRTPIHGIRGAYAGSGAPVPQMNWRDALLAPARLMTAGQRSRDKYPSGLLGDLAYNTDPANAFGGYGNMLAMVMPPGAARGGLLGPRAKPFYSELENIVQNLPMKKGSPQQWEGTIKNAPGFKPEEFDWTGLGDFLKSKTGPVTKSEVLSHVRENKVQVEEVLYGRPEAPVKKPRVAAARGPQMKDLFTGRMRTVREPPPHATLEDIATVQRQARYHWRELQNDLAAALGGADREMAGRTNPIYPTVGPWIDRIRAGDRAAAAEAVPILRRRRTNLEMPAITQTNDEGGILFTSGGQPFKETSYEHSTLPGLGGKNYRELLLKLPATKVGLPEGRFETGHWPDDPNTLAHIRFKDYTDFESKKVLGIHEIQSDWHQRGQKRGYADPNALAQARVEEKRLHEEFLRMDSERTALFNKARTTPDMPPAEQARYHELGNAIRDDISPRLSAIRGRINDLLGGVPDAPLKTKWHELALKRMIKWAADNGYDKVAWPSTAEQVARIENWGNIRQENGKWLIRGRQDVTPIVERYLTDLPRAANKLGAKYGAKVGMTTFTEGKGAKYHEERFYALPVTSELRKHAYGKGFSTFAVPGAIAGGLLAKKVSEDREKEQFQNARGLLGR